MTRFNRQGGVVLILVLILLLVLSVAALASMRLATLEAQLSAGLGERSHARHLAEAALIQAETWVAEAGFALTADARLCQAEGSCFSNQCLQGLCFIGSYQAVVDAADRCTLLALDPDNLVFQRSAWWADSAKTQVWNQYDGEGDLLAPVRTLIEWRCFIPLNPLDPTNADNAYQPSHWQPLYRISAYTLGRTGSARLLVQSLFVPGIGRQSWREVAILFTS